VGIKEASIVLYGGLQVAEAITEASLGIHSFALA
jgi:hypothetical protein